MLAVASFGAFLAFLDATVVNLAVPSLQESFASTSLAGLSWVLNAYNVVFAALLIAFGRLADVMGRRRIFSAGTLLFTLASAACALAPSVPLLLLARVVQAVGAAMLVPASLAIVIAAFPPGRRTQAIGAWGASAAVAAAVGPVLGGALIGAGGWRWAFLVNVPFGFAAVLLTRRALVESRSPGRRETPDLTGAALLAGSLGLVVLSVAEGNSWGWTGAGVLGALLAALLLSAGFVRRSRRRSRPLLDADLLRIPSCAWANAATLVAGMGFFAYLLANVLWLTGVWRYTALQTGLALVPGALVAALTAAALGKVAQRRGSRPLIVVAAVVWSGAYVWYATVLQPQPDFLRHWLPGQVLSGIGSGAVLPLLGSTALQAIPRSRFATSSAMTTAARQAGGALGVAALVAIVGVPAAGPAMDRLKDGWLFSAACFAVVALVALLALRRPQPPAADEADPSGQGSVRMLLPDPADTHAEMETALRPYARGNYLDDLPSRLRQRFETSGSQVALRAGDWLFHEGDRAESMYVLTAGRLEVLQGTAVIRDLGPGAVLGELALLSGGDTRSASIRARRDSVLSEVSRPEFETIMGEEPGAPMAVAEALARALQSKGRRREESSSQARLVAVVGVSASSPVGEVAHALEELLVALPTRPRVHLTGEVDAETMARAERDNDRVIVVAPWPAHVPDGGSAAPGTAWWEACRRQADRIVLVAGRDEAPPTGWTMVGAVPDLVLTSTSASTGLSTDLVERWCEAVRPDRVLGCRATDPRDGLRSLAAAIGGCAIGLVLAGGGARALTHIGVLHEFESAGIVVDRVAGCSLGALIAGAYATGRTAREVEDAAYDEFVRRNPFSDYTVPTKSLVTGRRSEADMRRHLGSTLRIEALPRQFRCVSTDLLGRTSYVHRAGLLWEAVAASARLPALLPPFRHDGRLLVDGGVLDNLPVGLLTERDEGPIVAVNIGNAGSGPRDPDRPPRIPGLGETLFRTMTIGSAGAVEKARAAGAFVLSPPSLGVGLVEFHQFDRMIEAGRMSARTLLEATGGDLLRNA